MIVHSLMNEWWMGWGQKWTIFPRHEDDDMNCLFSCFVGGGCGWKETKREFGYRLFGSLFVGLVVSHMKKMAFMFGRIPPQPAAIEFFVHLSLAAGVASVNSLSTDNVEPSSIHHQQQQQQHQQQHDQHRILHSSNTNNIHDTLSRSENHHAQQHRQVPVHQQHQQQILQQQHQQRLSVQPDPLPLSSPPPGVAAAAAISSASATMAPLNLQWRSLQNVEYLTDGGNSWIHSAVYQGKPVVIKTLKPEAQDLVVAMNEMECEMTLHGRLHHENIVPLIGAGTTSKGVRFLVLERLDGGTLAQMLGYDTRIRDRRRRFWRKKQFSYLDVLRIGRATAEAMKYLHESAIPGSMVLHRDLKPDNIGTKND
jgi:Protein kinase domain